MAELFEKGRSTITEHLRNIFETGELDENSVCRDFRYTAEDGKKYKTKYYNLKAIVAVGYRVNLHRATEFRKRATEILHEYIIKGFAMDDERPKQMKHFGNDYFDEMLEQIREIRLSERSFTKKSQICMFFLLTTILLIQLPKIFLRTCKILYIEQ